MTRVEQEMIIMIIAYVCAFILVIYGEISEAKIKKEQKQIYKKLDEELTKFIILEKYPNKKINK